MSKNNNNKCRQDNLIKTKKTRQFNFKAVTPLLKSFKTQLFVFLSILVINQLKVFEQSHCEMCPQAGGGQQTRMTESLWRDASEAEKPVFESDSLQVGVCSRLFHH